MLSKYFFMTGIVLGIMVALDLLLFGTIDLLWGVEVLLTLVFLLAPIYCAKFGRGIKIAFSIVMGIISIVPNLIFILLIVLISANLPRGRPFEEKVVVRPAPEVEVAAYKRWIYMYKGLKEECFSHPRGLVDNPFDYTQPQMDELFSRECEAERAKLLNFHAENVFSIPLFQYKDGYVASTDMEFPRLYVLDMYRIELVDVARRLDKGDIKGAQQRYIRLWQATENQLSPKLSTLILTMFSNAEVGLLTEFYKKYADKLQLEHNKELINILKRTIPKMDSAITASFIGEYAFSKGIFLKFTKDYCFKNLFSFEENHRKSYSERIIETRLLRWPFYDCYKTLKTADEFSYETIELNRKPIYKRERQRQEYCKKEEEFKAEWLRLENPVGNIFLAITMPRIGVIINRKDVKKAQTTAMLYLLTVTDPNNPDEIPTDNLTGKKFQVAVQKDTLEIQTEHKDYKDEVHYKVKRKF